MKRLLISCLLVVGCTSEYERKYGESEAEYEKRAEACQERAVDEYVFTLVDTDRWRVGTTPFWSTAEQVRATLGPPDTSYQAIQIEYAPKIESFGYGHPSEGANGYVDVTVINDSLAYISHAELGSEPLVTDRGQFAPGAPLADLYEAFPESYQCRDCCSVGSIYRIDQQYYPVLIATDSTRGAHMALLFRDGKLHSVGTDYYMQVRERIRPSG